MILFFSFMILAMIKVTIVNGSMPIKHKMWHAVLKGAGYRDFYVTYKLQSHDENKPRKHGAVFKFLVGKNVLCEINTFASIKLLEIANSNSDYHLWNSQSVEHTLNKNETWEWTCVLCLSICQHEVEQTIWNSFHPISMNQYCWDMLWLEASQWINAFICLVSSIGAIRLTLCSYVSLIKQV